MPRRGRLVPIPAVLIAVASLAATARAENPALVSSPPASAPADTAKHSAAHSSTGREPETPAPRIHPHWALVLSGGAARGIAHIGVLRALEEEGLRPGLVCGTSMGALIGALYATGYSSSQIRDFVRQTDWDEIFGKERESYEWRDTTIPQPWIALIGEGLQLHLPSGVVDDSYLNFTLATYFLPTEAMARGDFDRLPIPFRCVGTDAETTNPVVFRSGSVARAVRASISIPPLFPAVPEGKTLLVDGGLASNLPVSTARALGPQHILAVDVSLPPVDLSDRSSLLEVSFSLFDRLNKRSQQDTLSSQDRLVWLTLPKYGPMDFAACDSLIELGYREARARIHDFAALVRADSGATPRDSTRVLLPPARPVVWIDRDGRPSSRADIARHLFGEAPTTTFEPAALRPAFEDVYRGDMFVSAWPSFTVAGDSTTITMSVESRPKSELLAAFGYDNDVQARLNGTLVLRPVSSRLPDKISIGATLDPLRKNLFFALEPHSLARGGDGWFLRGGWRQTDVRLFDADHVTQETRVERAEGTAGLQKRLTKSYLLQAGAGYGFARSDERDLYGALIAARIQSGSVFGEGIQGVLLTGKDSYVAVIARALADVRVGSFIVRTSARAGTSSKLTPPDELQALGGPESFGGLQRKEWLGRDRLAAELRLIHGATTIGRVFAYGQAGVITQSVSRPDLDGEIHFAGGAGFEAAVPFGPLNLDWGIDDAGDFRFDVNFGQRF
jgi:predicted acylesterase/phospholipase RssA